MRAKCPECSAFSDFRPLGPYRMQCSVCGAVVKNDEVVEQIDKTIEVGTDELREFAFQVGGAATRPLLEDHPQYIFPSERVKEAVEFVLDEFLKSKEELSGSAEAR